MSNRYISLLTVTFAMLIPSVAMAAPGDQLVAGGMKIWEFLEPSLLPYKAHGTWGLIASVVCTALTLTWLLGYHEKIRDIVGRLGGFAVLPIAMMVAWMILGMTWGLVTGTIQGFLSAYLWDWLASVVMWVIRIMLVWGVIKYVVGNASGIIKQIGEFIKSQIVGPLTGAYKTPHIVLGAIMISGLINRKGFNEQGFYALSIVSSLFGLYTLAFKHSTWGQKQVNKAKAKVLHKPLEDGSWFCPNFWEETKKVAGKEIKDKHGKPQKVRTQCGHLNPAEAERCMSKVCDHPNPYGSWICPGCKYKGEGASKGMAWDTHKCPKCATHQPARPATTPRHRPEDDQYSAGTPGAPAPVQQPAVVQPVAGASAPAPQVAVAPVPQVAAASVPLSDDEEAVEALFRG